MYCLNCRYFEDDEEDGGRNTASYQPAPGSPGELNADVDDALDAYMVMNMFYCLHY